jgi:hypothetical protein
VQRDMPLMGLASAQPIRRNLHLSIGANETNFAPAQTSLRN